MVYRCSDDDGLLRARPIDRMTDRQNTRATRTRRRCVRKHTTRRRRTVAGLVRLRFAWCCVYITFRRLLINGFIFTTYVK